MFAPFKQWAEQDTETYVIANNAGSLAVGDAVTFGSTADASGFILPCQSTGGAVYGVVVGFAASPGGTKSQQDLILNNTTGNAMFVTPITNQSTEMVRARILPVRQQRLFIADLTQTAGTTAGSQNAGFFSITTIGAVGVQFGKLDEQSWIPPTTDSGSAGPGRGARHFFSIGSGLATANNVVYPLTPTQVVGFFGNQKTF